MPAVPGGPVIGNQPSALLTIVNVDSGVSFSAPTYFFTENISYALIPVLRTGSSQGTTTVQFATSPADRRPLHQLRAGDHQPDLR